VSEVLRLDSANQLLRENFLRWQCRVRQICVREQEGKPDDSMMPAVFLGLGGGDDTTSSELFGHIITVMCKSAPYSKVPELKHMVKKTNDPASRRKDAVTLLSETYYQKATEFSDILTSTFLPGSEGARDIQKAGHCRLRFDAYNQRYDLACKVWRLSQHNPLWQATYWHNMLFNPSLPPDTIILGFEPDWARCTADPSPI